MVLVNINDYFKMVPSSLCDYLPYSYTNQTHSHEVSAMPLCSVCMTGSAGRLLLIQHTNVHLECVVSSDGGKGKKGWPKWLHGASCNAGRIMKYVLFVNI